MKKITMESLQMRFFANGSITQFNEYVLVTSMGWPGFTAEIYKVANPQDYKEKDILEKELKLVKKAEDTFEDGGHALQWCFETLKAV